MRRGLAGLIVGLSLVVASVAWGAFVLTHTVLDPGRSERLAAQLLDNETLREAMVGRLAAGMEAALPAGTPVPRSVLEQAADTALESPAVEAIVVEGIVAAHRNALEGNVEPVTLDAGALGEASRQSLIDARPELDGVLPAAPAFSVEIPTTGLNWLGAIRRVALRITWILGLLATAGSFLALLITKDRPSVLKRVAMWAFGAAAFWLVVGFAVPFLARTVAPTSAAVIAAMVDVFFGAMIRPAIGMALFGGVLFALSMTWTSFSDQRGSRLANGGPPGAQPKRRAGAPLGAGGQMSNVRPGADPAERTTAPVPAAPPARNDASTGGPPDQEPIEATRLLPAQQHPAPGGAGAAPRSEEQRPKQRWIEGIGYIDDPAARDDTDPGTGGPPSG